MRRPTKLRLIGVAILLFNLWLIGHYDLSGAAVLLLTFGFAASYEFLLVRPLSTIPSPRVKISNISAINLQPNDQHWARALGELNSEGRKPGLWARVFAEAEGNESKAQAKYLSARAQEMVQEDMERELELERSAQQMQQYGRQTHLMEPVETGVIGDRPYAMFRDGSVELETSWGVKRRFPSMRVAREYIGQ